MPDSIIKVYDDRGGYRELRLVEQVYPTGYTGLQLGPSNAQVVWTELRLPKRRARTRLMPHLGVAVRWPLKNGKLAGDFRWLPIDKLNQGFSVSYNRSGRFLWFDPEDVPRLLVAIDEVLGAQT